ncbi:MAG: transposase [Oscillospiraceae bacterium]
MPKRKQIRLQGYDYSSNGAYFVTICTNNRQELLCEICRGGALLLPIGTICENEISQLQKRYMIKIDKYVIMPNHIHMVIVIDEERAEQSPSPTISDIICTFKSLTTKLSNANDNITGRKIWQRSFHDHIIRNENEYQKICQYIDTNPQKWDEDCFLLPQHLL